MNAILTVEWVITNLTTIIREKTIWRAEMSIMIWESIRRQKAIHRINADDIIWIQDFFLFCSYLLDKVRWNNFCVDTCNTKLQYR